LSSKWGRRPRLRRTSTSGSAVATKGRRGRRPQAWRPAPRRNRYSRLRHRPPVHLGMEFPKRGMHVRRLHFQQRYRTQRCRRGCWPWRHEPRRRNLKCRGSRRRAGRSRGEWRRLKWIREAEGNRPGDSGLRRLWSGIFSENSAGNSKRKHEDSRLPHTRIVSPEGRHSGRLELPWLSRQQHR
jgi:hypothetical protein